MPLTIEIVTPEKLAYHTECDHVVLPTLDGEIDVLPGHRPMIVQVEPGEVLIYNPGKNKVVRPNEHGYDEKAGTDIAISRGFARIQGDVVSILTEAAIDVDVIDEHDVQMARERAEAALKKAEEENLDAAEVERLEMLTRFSAIQLLAKSKKR